MYNRAGRLTSIFSLILFTYTASATTITAVENGNWVTPETWNCDCRPQRPNMIVIPQNISVSITRPVMLGPANYHGVTISVAGILDLTNGSLHLDSLDRIVIHPGGAIKGSNFGGTIFHGLDAMVIPGGSQLSGPATVTSSVVSVSLLSFTADKTESGIELAWASSGEIEIATYELLRSSDGISFQSIGKVAAQAYSIQRRNYLLTDIIPVDAGVYYRLDVIDADGVASTLSIYTLSVAGPVNTANDFVTGSPK